MAATDGGASPGKAAQLVRRAGVVGMAGSMVGGLVLPATAPAAELPEDRAEAMFHVYDGGGVRATGPALLVRKSLADKVSLSGTYYVDMVSNASIDVVTTASPFRERRTETRVGLDYAVREAEISLGASSSREPDYQADSFSLDVAEEVFGGMSTVSLGFTRAWDRVGETGIGYFDTATHWQYRIGLSQVLTPRWIASLNAEAIHDDGFLGSPYRAAREFGTKVDERNPRTRGSRAVKLSVIGDIGQRQVLHASWRTYWDTWDVRGQTIEAGASTYVQNVHLLDVFLRHYSQKAALFYSNDSAGGTTYLSRNRQLATFTSIGLGGKLAWSLGRLQSRFDTTLNAAYEFKRFRFKDFTDIRTGEAYSHNAHVLELTLAATF